MEKRRPTKSRKVDKVPLVPAIDQSTGKSATSQSLPSVELDIVKHDADPMDLVLVNEIYRRASISQEGQKDIPLLSRLDTLTPIIEHAIAVIGDRDEALRWLGTPVRSLGCASPVSLLGTKEGAERVDDILGQIEHGTW